jgi:hypothetical protein
VGGVRLLLENEDGSESRVQPTRNTAAEDAAVDTVEAGQDLRSHGLDLGNDVGAELVDEGVEADAAEVEETGVEDAAELELGKVELVEDTGVGEEEEIGQLLEEEDVLDGELASLELEEVGEGVDVEVVLDSELLEEAEVQVVDVQEVVKVDLVELVEAAEDVGIKVEGALLNLLLSSRGRSDHGGEGRDEESGGLHFCWWGVNDSSQTIKRIRSMKSTAQKCSKNEGVKRTTSTALKRMTKRRWARKLKMRMG